MFCYIGTIVTNQVKECSTIVLNCIFVGNIHIFLVIRMNAFAR